MNVVVKHGDKTLENGVDYTLEFADNTAAGTAKVTINGMGADTGSVERSFEITLAEPVLEGVAVKAAPAKTIYKVGDKRDPAGRVLVLSFSNGTTREVAYGSDTAAAFSFVPALDTVLDQENPALEVTVAFYKVGDKLDPAGLVLVLSFSNGTTREVAYGSDTAAAFSFVPALDTVLDQENPALEVTVAYEGKTAVFDVRVEKAEDPKPEPGPDPKPDPEPNPDPEPEPKPEPNPNPTPTPDPEQPGGGSQGDQGNQGANGKPGTNGGLVQTGDPAGIAGIIAMGGAAALVAARRRRR